MTRLVLAALAFAALAAAQAPSGFILPSAPSAFPAVQNAGTDVVCALHADVISGLTCNNQITDGTSTTAFASTTTIPAGTLSANTTAVNLTFGYISSGTAATAAISLKLGSTVIYTSNNNIQANSQNAVIALSCSITAAAAASSTTPIVAACTVSTLGNGTKNTLLLTTTKSIAVDTTVAQVLSVTNIFGANTAGNALWLYSISPGSTGTGAATPAAPFAPSVNAGTDVVCAKGADTITGLTCNNAADATSATAFSSSVTIPAGTMSANVTKVDLLFGAIGSGTPATAIVSIKLGSTVIYTGTTINTATTNTVFRHGCQITAAAAASATTPIVAACTTLASGTATRNTLLSTTTKSIAVDTTVAQTLSVTVIFGANTTQNALWLYSISQ